MRGISSSFCCFLSKKRTKGEILERNWAKTPSNTATIFLKWVVPNKAIWRVQNWIGTPKIEIGLKNWKVFFFSQEIENGSENCFSTWKFYCCSKQRKLLYLNFKIEPLKLILFDCFFLKTYSVYVRWHTLVSNEKT